MRNLFVTARSRRDGLNPSTCIKFLFNHSLITPRSLQFPYALPIVRLEFHNRTVDSRLGGCFFRIESLCFVHVSFEISLRLFNYFMERLLKRFPLSKAKYLISSVIRDCVDNVTCPRILYTLKISN